MREERCDRAALLRVRPRQGRSPPEPAASLATVSATIQDGLQVFRADAMEGGACHAKLSFEQKHSSPAAEPETATKKDAHARRRDVPRP